MSPLVSIQIFTSIHAATLLKETYKHFYAKNKF